MCLCLLFVCLSVCLSVCRFVGLSVCRFVGLSGCRFVWLSGCLLSVVCCLLSVAVFVLLLCVVVCVAVCCCVLLCVVGCWWVLVGVGCCCWFVVRSVVSQVSKLRRDVVFARVPPQHDTTALFSRLRNSTVRTSTSQRSHLLSCEHSWAEQTTGSRTMRLRERIHTNREKTAQKQTPRTFGTNK